MEALQRAEAARESFDLLVSDVYMPGMNGIELADRLLARERALAILLISSRGGEPEIRRRLAPGDVAFLAKPFSPGELVAKVEEASDRAGRRGSDRALAETPAPAGTRPGIPRGAIQLAGALALVLGLGAAFSSLELSAPPLPAPIAEGATRSATIEVVAPLGPLAETPGELTWRPIEGARSYALSLRTIDGTALWQAEVAAPPADIPVEVEGAFHRAVTYYWSVEALDADGRILARSELAPFVVELADRAE